MARPPRRQPSAAAPPSRWPQTSRPRPDCSPRPESLPHNSPSTTSPELERRNRLPPGSARWRCGWGRRQACAPRPLLHRQHRKRHIREISSGRQVDAVDEVTRGEPAMFAGSPWRPAPTGTTTGSGRPGCSTSTATIPPSWSAPASASAGCSTSRTQSRGCSSPGSSPGGPALWCSGRRRECDRALARSPAGWRCACARTVRAGQTRGPARRPGCAVGPGMDGLVQAVMVRGRTGVSRRWCVRMSGARLRGTRMPQEPGGRM
jgi:hypothetical protein